MESIPGIYRPGVFRIGYEKAGLENAKRKCKKLGRPGVDDSVIEEAKILKGQGKSFRIIGKQLGINEGVVRQSLKA